MFSSFVSEIGRHSSKHLIVIKKYKPSGLTPILLLLTILFLHKYIDVEKDVINGKSSVVEIKAKEVHLTQVDDEGLSWTEELLIHFTPQGVID